MNHLTHETKLSRASNSASAATTAINGAIIDTQGFDEIRAIAVLGDVTSGCVLTLTLEENDVNSGTGMTAISGASATFTAGASDADNKLLIVDWIKTAKRYVRPVLTRTTANAVVDAILVEQAQPRALPVTQSSDVLVTDVGSR